VTTGAPLYLVSACASAEEFVAAFRRYADRSGLFVPIADPLPQGRRGRVALALKDGRIVLEGEVEIAVSNIRPSPLYGRVGMTLKFVEPDAPTKTTLGELEKARLAMKPPPLSIPPRAGEVPAEPRPTVPPTGGRIDAANALAECVAIGDLAIWRDATAPKGDSAKFVIPTIPQVGAARPKTPSVPPALQPKLPVEVKPPPTPGSPPPVALPPKVVTPPVGVPSTTKEQKATTMGMPAIDRMPGDAKSTDPELPLISKSMTMQGIEPPRPTTMGMPPVLRAPVSSTREQTTPIPRRDPTPLPRKGDSIQIPKREGPVIGKQTTLGMPIVRPPADTLESPAPPPPAATGAATAPRRAHTPSTPPAPRHPTPYAPLPIVRMPALAQSLDETTERTGIPEAPPIGGGQRKTSLGIQMMTASPVETNWDEDDEENKATEQQDAVEPPSGPPASRSGGLRASEIMAAIQGEDWTMTPDASTPTVLPKDELKDLDAKAAEEKSGPLPGDWAISLDPAAPGGWSAPAKVEKPPELQGPPPSGNRNIAVASAMAIEAVEWEEKPTGIGEALVEIDPSLMDPAKRVDDEEPVNIVSTPIADVPPPPPPLVPFNGASLPLAAPALPMFAATMQQAQPPPLPPPPLAVSYPTPPPLPPSRFPPATPLPPPPLPNASASYPSIPFVVDPTDSIQTKRKRTIILAIAAAVAVALTVVVILWTSDGKKSKPDPIATPGSGSAVVAIPEGSGSAQVVQPPPPPPPAIDAGVAAPALCDVDVTTNPTGAEIAIDNAVVGTSPATVHLPCGVETKVSVKKAKFGSATRSITASPTANKLAIKIAAPMFQLKVTSVPSGATITVGGKVVGITPTAVKVAAFSPTMITVTKDGYVADTEKIAPRVNNATHHVVLKKSVKPKLR